MQSLLLLAPSRAMSIGPTSIGSATPPSGPGHTPDTSNHSCPIPAHCQSQASLCLSADTPHALHPLELQAQGRRAPVRVRPRRQRDHHLTHQAQRRAAQLLSLGAAPRAPTSTSRAPAGSSRACAGTSRAPIAVLLRARSRAWTAAARTPSSSGGGGDGGLGAACQ
mgnify:CR=1 FL=1